MHRPPVTVTRAHLSPRGFSAPLPRRCGGWDEGLHADFDLGASLVADATESRGDLLAW